MDVLMTVKACLEGGMIVDIDQHLFPIETGPHMALGALHALVFARQRVGGILVSALNERRGLPIIDRVAGAAFAAIGPMLELPPMRVHMTVQTFFVGHRGREVRIFMTLKTGDVLVLAGERELRHGMVETVGLPHVLPVIGTMAAFAGLLERAMVRILVASRACLKR